MKVWKIERVNEIIISEGYNYQIILAETTEDARKMAADNAKNEGPNIWLDLNESEIRELTKPQVLLAIG